MKKYLSILLSVLMIFCLVGCASSNEEESDSSDASAEEETVKVALIASSSGLGDKSFNDAAWEGFQQAETELGVEIKVVEPKDVADYVSSASTLAEAGYQMIFATGSDWGDTLTEVAELYPEVHFVGLNVSAEGDNVTIARTADHQIAFLAGALAAMMSKSGTVGYLGGKENASQVRFQVAYEEGAKYINSDINVLSTFVGAFNDPTTGKEYALEENKQGADVIFHTAGQSGQGLFQAIQEIEDLYAIGVDSNQDYIVPGKILTTAEKHLQVIAYDMIKQTKEGTITSGTTVYNLANDGVGLSEMEYTKDIIGEENINKLNDIKEKIISGDIEVTDTFEQQ